MVRHLQVLYHSTISQLHTAKKQISSPKDGRYNKRPRQILTLDSLCQKSQLDAKFYFGAAGGCAQASAAEFLTCESQISYS
jgi:hypothetical protein